MPTRHPLRREHTDQGSLTVSEVRLVADLRIMHSKVDELYQIISNLKRRHSHAAIHKYADPEVLSEDIARVDEIYLWFVKIKEQRERQRKINGLKAG